MMVHIVTCNNIEAEGEVEIVGVFATAQAAEAARRAHAADCLADEDDPEEYTDDDARWDLCGGLTVYEIHSGEVQTEGKTDG